MPTAFEPVKETRAHRGRRDDRLAHLAAAADHHVDHARRQPRLGEDLEKSAVHAGVSVAGLNTTVLPATSAGAAFHTGIAHGKFQGVISPTGPSGWRSV